MRKRSILSVLAICLAFLCSFNSAKAENYTYKLYNPNLNKTTDAALGTISISENSYIWGLYTKNMMCVVNMEIDTNKAGLVGGKCTDMEAFNRLSRGENVDISKYDYGWREYNKNTFFKELDSIKAERKAQGKSLSPSAENFKNK